MDIDEDDDFYAPEEPDVSAVEAPPAPVEGQTESKHEAQDDDLEEGEEEDEGGEMMDEEDDSDIDIITERKDGSQPAPPSQSKYSEIRNIPQRSTANDATVKAAPVKDDSRASGSGQELPGISTSKIDVNAIPVHKGTGKPITQLNIDEDLKENEKPWRQPGTDISDYFNYGFDEFTWALYADKQERLRGEYNQDSIAQGQKKMMEDMMMMMGMPGLPGANGSGAGAGASQMPAGFDGMTPEMQAMMQQMMMGGGGGMDGQMDPSAMAAMFAGMQNGGGGGGGAQGGQGQNFQGGFAGAQGQGYGYDQQMAGAGAGGGGGSRGNFGGGRGRGGRRNW